MSETDLLNDFTEEPIPADKGVRFANLIIDTIAFYILVVIIGFVFAVASPETAVGMADSILFNLFFFGIYILYFALFEGFSNGKTLGKMITKTRAIKRDGSVLTMKDALKRGAARAVPFEAFSALMGSIWHDKWTNTIVIKENRV